MKLTPIDHDALARAIAWCETYQRSNSIVLVKNPLPRVGSSAWFEATRYCASPVSAATGSATASNSSASRGARHTEGCAAAAISARCAGPKWRGGSENWRRPSGDMPGGCCFAATRVFTMKSSLLPMPRPGLN